jgi:hypothetical protein
MEALTIVAGSLLFGLILLIASERQISNSRKHRTHDHDHDPFPPGKSSAFSEDYSDIFHPKRGKTSRVKKIPDLDYGSFMDNNFPVFDEKDSPRRSSGSKRQSPITSYLNFMTIAILVFLLLKYFEII